MGEGQNSGEAPSVDGDSYSYSQNLGFVSSASISGDVFFKIKNGYNGPVKAYKHTYFKKYNVEGSSFEPISDINNFYNKLGLKYAGGAEWTVKEWPKYLTETNNIVINYGSGQERQENSNSESVSINGFSSAASTGSSYANEQQSKSVQLPNALCEGITFSAIGGDLEGTINYGVSYGVFPSTISATVPPKFNQGEYLVESSVDFFRDQYLKIEAITVIIEGDILPV